jgi:hypothetical protein
MRKCEARVVASIAACWPWIPAIDELMRTRFDWVAQDACRPT